MRANRQENHRFFIQPVAKTELAIPDMTAFLTDDVNDAEITVNARCDSHAGLTCR